MDINGKDRGRSAGIKNGEPPVWMYYAALLFVVGFWGISSVMYPYFYQYYSAAVLTSIMTLFSALVFWIVARKKLSQLNGQFLKIALPICCLNGFANVLNRIGLQYTTPANYAFFEHVSCIVVPVMMYVFIRKKPTLLQGGAGICCLIGCFILSGVSFSGEGAGLGIGDALCIIAGVLIGICVAAIGAYMQKMDVTLFMALYMTTYFCVSVLMAVVLNMISPDGVPMEKAVITWDPLLLVLVIVFGLVDIALCWLLRTEAIRHIDPVTVATVSPFAAVITGVISVMVGIDTLTPNLVIGGTIIFISATVPDVVSAIAGRRGGTQGQA